MGLDDIAAAIADGKPVRWTDAGVLQALTPDLARRARIVERIAQLHASFPPPSTFASLQQASLLPLDAPTQPDNDTLLTWGPLTIVERIGSGSFGEVYRATDPRLNRPVALKLLRRRDRRESIVVDEGHLMARVRHPNVITIYGAERIDGRVGLWMEYVDGPTLDHDIETAPGGELAGTPLYLAPEVLNGQRASPASDIYSLECCCSTW